MAVSSQSVARRMGVSPELVDLLRRTRGTTNSSLQVLSASGLRKAMRRISYPDSARARHEQSLKIARDDDGRIPANPVARALLEVAGLRTRGRPAGHGLVAGVPVAGTVQPARLMGSPAPLLPPTAGLSRQGWQWLGPGNVGGRTRALVIHPGNPDQMLAASAGGGVWFSSNGGGRWAPVDDFMANLAVSCLAINPVDPGEVIAGTGEGFGNGDALRGGGLFRIRDMQTWTPLPTTASLQAVNRVAITADGKSVLAATPDGIRRSTGPARSRWKQVHAGGMADVKCHPTDAREAVAGGLQGECLFSRDGGVTWSRASHAGAWSGRVELAYAAKDPRIVYASVDAQAGQIWKSSDGGRTFSRRTALTVDGEAAEFLGDQGWYGNVLWAGDPGDENLLLVGGINLWRSTDGGATLAEISTWSDDTSAHADQHCIVAHPGYDGRTNFTVFFGNDGGIFKAADLRQVGSEAEAPFVAGWQELNNNYGVTQFFGAAVHPGTGRVVAGAQDNGTLVLDPGAGPEQWRSWFGGDGGSCAADAKHAKVFYGEYVYLNIHRNTDACATSDPNGERYISGQFWNGNDWAWKPVPFQIPEARTQDALFIAPFVMDPGNPDRLLAGGLSLWQTVDAQAPNTFTSGPRWRAIKASTGAKISAIAVHPLHPGVVWVGHEDGSVYLSTDATVPAPTWKLCHRSGAGGLLPRRLCTRIVAHPRDANTAYATFGGFVKDNAWKTTDSGSTWKPIAAGLPRAPVRGLQIHPSDDKRLYIGTEVGLFASANGGTSWSPTNEGPANVSVEEMLWNGTTLYCATHGRGMFRIELP